MLYPSSNPAGNQSTAPAIDADHLYAMTVEPQLAYRKKARYCRKCGKRLSGYNRGKTCFHHPTPAQAEHQPRRRVVNCPAKTGGKPVKATVLPADRCLARRDGHAPRHYHQHLSIARKLGYASLSAACLKIYAQTESLQITAMKLGYATKHGVRRYIMAAGGTLRPTGKPSRDAKIRRLAVGQ